MNDKIAILSHGSISPLGCDDDNIWKGFQDDKAYMSFDKYWKASIDQTSELEMAQLVQQYPKYKKLDRSVLLAIIAAEKTIRKVNLGTNRIGVNIGSSRGATESFEEHISTYLEYDKAPLLSSPLTTLGNISSNVARHLNLFGPIISHSITCSTALQAVTNAYAWLQAGMADYFLVGGSEAPLTDFTVAQMKALGIYSKEENTNYPCQPLGEINNNSMILGEGASTFILAKHREGQAAEAIIDGLGYGFETSSSLTGVSENAQCLKDSMTQAIQNCESDAPIDLVLLHAPGTKKGDQSEMNAVNEVLSNVNTYSSKYKIGHTLGASGAFNMELAIHCLKHQKMPNIPYSTSIKNDERPIRKVMINAMGFGGNASSIILSSPEIF